MPHFYQYCYKNFNFNSCHLIVLGKRWCRLDYLCSPNIFMRGERCESIQILVSCFINSVSSNIDIRCIMFNLPMVFMPKFGSRCCLYCALVVCAICMFSAHNEFCSKLSCRLFLVFLPKNVL